MRAVLILNSDCTVSAITTPEEYRHFAYKETGMVVMVVEVSEVYFALIKKIMWEERQNVYVLPEDSYGAHKLLPQTATYFWCDLQSDPPALSLPF